jgi:hypothetical protein
MPVKNRTCGGEDALERDLTDQAVRVGNDRRLELAALDIGRIVPRIVRGDPHVTYYPFRLQQAEGGERTVPPHHAIEHGCRRVMDVDHRNVAEPQPLHNFADMAGIECVVIDQDTRVADFKKELRWNQVYYHVASGV